MKTIRVQLAGDFTQGEPLRPSLDEVQIPSDAVEEKTELVYRVKKRVGEAVPGDLLIIDLRSRARTGELVIAVKDGNVYLGRFWGKHGLRELRPAKGGALQDFQIVGAVNQILRGSR